MCINHPSLKTLVLALFMVGSSQTNIQAQGQFTPVDVGQTVNGFQDDFAGAARDPNWVAVGPAGDLYEQVDGLLRVTAASGDPNHLLYTAPGYSDAVQEVLARIRLISFDSGAYPRGGIGVGVNVDTSQGIELHFRDWTDQAIDGHLRHLRLLDDLRAWGPGVRPPLPTGDWTTNSWYWLRLRQTGSSSATGANIHAKMWLADGTMPEPEQWQLDWGRDGRTGFAGIAGSSSAGGTDGAEIFEVDYVLIKAEGLPSIKVATSAFPTPFFLSITEQPKDTTVGPNQTANFTVQVASSAPATFQWQRAAPGSSTFSDVSGATTATLTTAALTPADEGAKYRVVLSLAGTTTTNISREATVHVDAVAPTLVSVRTLGSSNKVTVVFSEGVTNPAGAGNFSIDNGVTITAAARGRNPNTFELTTSALSVGTTYNLTINGVVDAFGNAILANTRSAINLSVEVPTDFTQTVNGFQDDFSAATRDPLWLPFPPEKDAYEQTNGLLKVTVVGDNPGLDTHLLYTATGYSDTVQEVLARIRVTNFGQGDPPRCGVAVSVDQETSQGLNLHFRDSPAQAIAGQSRHVRMLDDRRAWGPGYGLTWENDTWYWLRFQQTGPTGPANLNAKVWKADGTVPEPDAWQITWEREGRVGLAGIVGSSVGGISEFEVDYILIKADGLPSIKVSPGAFGFGPFINITQQPSDAVVQPGQNVTLTVAANGSGTPTFQWQKANPGSSNFVDIANATSSSLTIPSPGLADNGAKYRAVISVPGFSKSSREALIVTDNVPPALVSARTLGNPRKVTVVFSEELAALGAAATFSIDNGVTISGRAPGLTPNVIELTTSEITAGRNYTLTVSGVRDLFNNEIAAGSTILLNLFVELPAEFGQSVNGFQDDFSGAVRDPNWVANGPAGDLYEQANGVLKVTARSGDPNHLLYTAPGYDDATQEVLARIRFLSFGSGDYPRGGIGVGVNGDTGQGIELNFRNSAGQAIDGRSRHFRLLDDLRAWGPGFRPNLPTGDWTTNQWYWLRLRQTGSSGPAGTTNIQAKVWLADGTEAEPETWQLNWNRSDRTGFAGITGSSSQTEGTEEFEVDYVLIKAEGLPSTTVAASAFSLRGTDPGVPSELGQIVNGYQDDFTGTTRDPNWVPHGPGGDLYVQGNGLLHVSVLSGDPNHLLYEAPGYNSTNQEVLARIRVTDFGSGDFPRAGLGVGVATNNSQGINLHFRNSSAQAVDGSPRHFRLLDDARAWGPAGLRPGQPPFDWQNNQWFWLRLRQEGNAAGGTNDVFGKVWLADGVTPEPAEWQLVWNYAPGRSLRSGFAGLTGSSGNGVGSFDVDYVLIKAEGLPAITVDFAKEPPEAPMESKFTGLTVNGNQLVLAWVGPGNLEEADTVAGPWSPVAGAGTPWTITMSGAAKFYRLRQ